MGMWSCGFLLFVLGDREEDAILKLTCHVGGTIWRAKFVRYFLFVLNHSSSQMCTYVRSILNIKQIVITQKIYHRHSKYLDIYNIDQKVILFVRSYEWMLLSFGIESRFYQHTYAYMHIRVADFKSGIEFDESSVYGPHKNFVAFMTGFLHVEFANYCIFIFVLNLNKNNKLQSQKYFLHWFLERSRIKLRELKPAFLLKQWRLLLFPQL